MTTLDTTVDVGETAVTLPSICTLDSAESVTEAVWPALIFTASASGKPATTWSFFMFSIVTTDDEEPVEELAELDGDDDPVEPFPPPPPVAAFEEDDEEEDADDVEPTVSPTEPFTAVTVPEIGARSVVARRVLSAFATAISSWRTCTLSCSTVGESTAESIVDSRRGNALLLLLHGEPLGGDRPLGRRDRVLVGAARGGGRREGLRAPVPGPVGVAGDEPVHVRRVLREPAHGAAYGDGARTAHGRG